MLKKTQKYATILKVKIDSTKTPQLLAKIDEKLSFEAKLTNFRNKFYIETPNPEIVLACNEDEELREIVNNADFRVPDGVGLKIFGDWNLNVIPGRKLMVELCRLSAEKGYRVLLLGSSLDSNSKSVEYLKQVYPNIKLLGLTGVNYDSKATPISQRDLDAHFDIVQKINNFKPHIIFVALGCPKQEFWIKKYLPEVNALSAMSVGGSLDYLSGKASVPPQLFEKLGLEWFWRLISQPARFLRIFRATVIFPIKIIFSQF